MVVPSEILHVLHARPLRDFLLRECRRLLLLDPDQVWFNDTLQGVVLLLAKRGQASDHRAAEISVVPFEGPGHAQRKGGPILRQERVLAWGPR